MYGCSTPLIVYGFSETNVEYIICPDNLESTGLLAYTDCVVRNNASSIVYGIRCKFDGETGTASISDEDRQIVHTQFKALSKLFTFEDPKFQTVVEGDWESSDHIEYDIDSASDVSDGEETETETENEIEPKPKPDIFNFNHN